MLDQDRPPEHIQAEDLYLRRHRVEDAAGVASAVTESLAELQKWMPWAGTSAVDVEAERRRLQEVVPRWEEDVEYVYLVLVPGQDRVLGCIGLHRRVGPTALEIGYWLRTDETGRGTMTKAVRALTTVALALPGIDRVEIHCDEANYRSAAVARRLGFALARAEEAEVKAPGEVGRRQIWVLDRAQLAQQDEQ